MYVITGNPVSPGKAMGRSILFPKLEEYISYEFIDNNSVSDEIDHFVKCLISLSNKYKESAKKLLDKGKEKEAKIILAHDEFLNDCMFVDEVLTLIKSGYNSVNAVKTVVDNMVKLFMTFDNDFFKERVDDIKDMEMRLIYELCNIEYPDINGIYYPAVIFAEDIPPSIMIDIDNQFIKGIVTKNGGNTSHAAIIAKEIGIPAIMGCKTFGTIRQDEMVFVDGYEGFVAYNLTDDDVIKYQIEIEKEQKINKSYEYFANKATVTKDNVPVSLFANVTDIKFIDMLKKVGAEGIGLFRTEMIYMNRTVPPSEEEQFGIYKALIENMNNLPVVIRTFDIGGDKVCKCIPLENESNPFLGVRGIRLSLLMKDLFKTQIKAILRASVYGNAMIMFPMVSSIDELLEAKKLVDDSKAELEEKGIEYREDIPIGIMIEVPAAAIMIDAFLRYVDFVSIGSNDLAQYTAAADRYNPRTSELCTNYNPALLRLINYIIKCCNKAGKRCSLCGEMASDPKLIPVLLGMGLKTFSVSSSVLLRTRKIINDIDLSQAKETSEKVLNLHTSQQVIKLLDQTYGLLE